MVGTLKYMAPEQVQGQKIDSRADLFSAGVVLYQLLTDKRPFDGDNDFSIIHQIIGHHPPAPSSINPRLPGALDAVVARALAKDRDERFATARDFAVALQSAIRRAEDQTVVPPPNPNRRVEALSRPLTSPGTVPPGGTVPGGVTTPGGSSTVTQELELVYWKDVKDSTDPEELQGFLERFPAGIYADLARRRLRRLAGGEQTVAAGVSQPGAATAAAFGPSVFSNSAFPNVEAGALPAAPAPEPAAAATGFEPTQWIEEEYTRTVTEPQQGAPSPAPAPVATERPQRAPEPPVRARKKAVVPVLAGIGVLAVAGVLAMVMGRDKTEAPPPASPVAAAPAAAPEPEPASTPAVATKAPEAPATASAPAARPAATSKAERERERAAAHRAAAAQKSGSHTAAAAAAAPEPSARAGVPSLPPPRNEADTARALPPPVSAAGANAANYQAVEQCRDRMFLSRELCLAEHCDKAGARNHPLCVKRREEARMREESKVPR
jgi:serine/threonine-protein kinase